MVFLDFRLLVGFPLAEPSGSTGRGSRRSRKRLDLLAVERGLAESRERARALVMAGDVLIDGRVAAKPGELVSEAAEISVRGTPPYVSRGGLKLAQALDAFGIDPGDKLAVDVGASTGGFTDVLLKRGARRVYAIDVGYGQLDWRLRNDPRVVVLERTNVRFLETLPEQMDLAVIDVSFISLKLVLPAVKRLVAPTSEGVALVKPQFEAGREQVGKGGVVRDPGVHRQVLHDVVDSARELDFVVAAMTPSPVLGPAGNREFLVHLRTHGAQPLALEEMVERALQSGGVGPA